MVNASIVTYKTDPEELRRCLDCLVADGVSKIFICDNSPDESLLPICSDYETSEYIPLHHNPGYGTAHNVALRKSIESGAKYHLVINSDVSFKKGVIPAILEKMEREDNIGVIQPRILSADGSLQYSQRLLPWPMILIGRRFLPGFLTRKSNRRYCLANWNHECEAVVPALQGSFMFFRVSAMDEIGLFDERFFMYPEDIDISRRMNEKHKVVFWPSVEIVHLHRAASYHNLKMLKVHIVNMIKYFNKWGWFSDKERREINRKALDRLGINS